MSTVDVRVLDSADALAHDVAARLLDVLALAQAEGRVPQIGLTGGTIAGLVHEQIAALAAADDRVDWSRVVVWWGDERFVAPDSDDRNARQARTAFLDPVGADPALVHEMPSTADAATAAEGAATYSDALRAHGAGEFDVLMLGVGPDGHIASLFPGHPALRVDDTVATWLDDSPKPPPTRITLTFGALNRAREVWFLVSGSGKADAVARALAESAHLIPRESAESAHLIPRESAESAHLIQLEADLIRETPARGVHGRELTRWWLDTAAAAALPPR